MRGRTDPDTLFNVYLPSSCSRHSFYLHRTENAMACKQHFVYTSHSFISIFIFRYPVRSGTAWRIPNEEMIVTFVFKLAFLRFPSYPSYTD